MNGAKHSWGIDSAWLGAAGVMVYQVCVNPGFITHPCSILSTSTVMVDSGSPGFIAQLFPQADILEWIGREQIDILSSWTPKLIDDLGSLIKNGCGVGLVACNDNFLKLCFGLLCDDCNLYL